ncbi:hypothetical protein GEU84_004550 [Fertoebacter nigrum]|uniref:Uncharacterized protein n=1 Tax=Fertoeibacter niger TaxID=2656921 RepID=A0A8X8GYB1_9RHOB|nr:hypothetical protein [Fertoeibacter niger]NUB43646.1 hypothetical protein [Fertoeibacter niger]
MNRRAVLAAGPALAFLPAAGTHAATEDPLLALHREWWAARVEWYRWANVEGNGNWDFPESVAAARREDVALKAILQARASGLPGIAAQVHVLWTCSGPGSAEWLPEYAEECGQYEFQAMLALWRIATGSDLPPPISAFRDGAAVPNPISAVAGQFFA